MVQQVGNEGFFGLLADTLRILVLIGFRVFLALLFGARFFASSARAVAENTVVIVKRVLQLQAAVDIVGEKVRAVAAPVRRTPIDIGAGIVRKAKGKRAGSSKNEGLAAAGKKDCAHVSPLWWLDESASIATTQCKKHAWQIDNLARKRAVQNTRHW
nr:hypothetical protein [Vandammella animalimorsus]